MAYKFQLGNARLGGTLQQDGGLVSTDVDDATAANIVAEIDNGEIPIAKLAQSSISGKSLGGNLDNLSAGDGLSGGTYNGGSVVTFAVDLKQDAGLQIDSGELAAKVDGAKAMEVGSDGLAVKLRADKGLNRHADGLEIVRENNKGITLNSNGIGVQGNANASVDVNNNGVSVVLANNKGLNHDGASGIEVVVNNAAGVAVDAQGLKVTLDSDALQFTSNNIDLKDTIAGNRTFSGNVIVGGDFQVNGSTVTLSASNLLIEDKIIQVAKDANSQASSKDSGILFGQGNANGARLLYEVDSGEQKLKAKQGSGNQLITIEASSFIGPATEIDPGNKADDAETFVVFTATASGPQTPHTNANLKFNSTNGQLTATSFSGDGAGLSNITADSTKRALLIADGTANVTVGNSDMGKILVFTDNVSNSGSGRTVTLPAHDAGNVGKSILIKCSNAASEPITVSRNGNTDKIDGQAGNITLQSDNAAVELIYLGNGAGNLEWIIV